MFKKIVRIFGIVFFLIPLYAQTAAIPMPELLEPERVTEISDDSTSISFRCDAGTAHVYLNGNYEGDTTLTLKSIMQGQYRLRIEKDGYESKEYLVHVERGIAQDYYIVLEKNALKNEETRVY